MAEKLVVEPQLTVCHCRLPAASFIMGFGDEIKELEQAATGQGGNDGDNNANKSFVFFGLRVGDVLIADSNGGNDKTEDTLGECWRTPFH